MTVVLALDVATNMGICVGTVGAAPRAWSLSLGKGGEDARFSRILTITAKLLSEHKPDLVAIEAPIGGGMKSDYLIGLAACARGVCANRGIRSEICMISSVRKHFLGKNLTAKDFPGKDRAASKRAIKAQVISRCGMLGWYVEDDDAADAAATFDFACAKFCGALSAPHGGLFRHG